MAAYFTSLDKTLLNNYLIAAGNAAHQARNHLTGKNNAETPELLIVDQLCAQMENLCRDILSLSRHNIDIQRQLTNSIRCCKLASRTLSNDIPSYVLQKIDEQEFSLIVQYIKSADTLFTKISKMIVCALTKSMISDFQLNLKIVDENSIDIIHTNGCDEHEGDDEDDMKLERNRNDPAFIMVENKNIEIDFKKSVLNIDQYTLQNPCTEMDVFVNMMDMMAKNGCNSSHEIQNNAAPFTRQQPLNVEAGQIVNIAGQMENQWRAIQMHLYNFKRQYPTHANVDNLKRNLCNQTKKQIDNIGMNLEKISKMGNKFDSIEAIEGSMQVLIAVFRSNFKLQFGL